MIGSLFAGAAVDELTDVVLDVSVDKQRQWTFCPPTEPLLSQPPHGDGRRKREARSATTKLNAMCNGTSLGSKPATSRL